MVKLSLVKKGGRAVLDREIIGPTRFCKTCNQRKRIKGSTHGYHPTWFLCADCIEANKHKTAIPAPARVKK